MNFIRFIGHEGFGVRIAIVAAVVAATEILLYKLKNVPAFVANYLPLIVAAAGTFVGELAASGDIAFSEDAFYESVIAYSLGRVLFVTVRKILDGAKPEDALISLVESLAESVCTENAKTEMEQIARIIRKLGSTDFSSLKTEVVSVLKTVAKDGVSKSEIAEVAETILLSAQKLKKEK